MSDAKPTEVSAEMAVPSNRRQSARKVIGAPIWLVERMKTLQQMPPPTLQEVKTSFRAAEEMRLKYEDNPNNSANGRKRPAT